MVTPEREKILHALREARNISEAARKLGASRRTLQNRMRKYGMPRGRAGRPQRPLPYGHRRGSGILLGALAAAGITFIAIRRRSTT